MWVGPDGVVVVALDMVEVVFKFTSNQPSIEILCCGPKV